MEWMISTLHAAHSASITWPLIAHNTHNTRATLGCNIININSRTLRSTTVQCSAVNSSLARVSELTWFKRVLSNIKWQSPNVSTDVICFRQLVTSRIKCKEESNCFPFAQSSILCELRAQSNSCTTHSTLAPLADRCRYGAAVPRNIVFTACPIPRSDWWCLRPRACVISSQSYMYWTPNTS